ncbi:MAG: 50S ribosome-binding GTPase [Acidimicrobiia bacterium]|nr:50S ribosome-binding GTPase [Acidimicrobiia bacterium]
MSDVVSALDMLDLAIGRAEGINADADIKVAAKVAATVRERRGFLGETLVVALAGGTGSGKSSLLNAIAGRRVAETGVLRPTTERALAWVPDDPEPGLVALLDLLEIDARFEQPVLPKLAIIDLPDHDSIVLQHQQIVERMLPHVDAVIWVFDPQKYRDPLIHEQYISQLLEYQEQFVFVLNQIDLLGKHDLSELRADLTKSLMEDGIASPRVFDLAAAPPGAKPLNIEPFRAFLRDTLGAKSVAAGKMLGDIRRAGKQLRHAAGVDRGAGVGFEDRWPSVRASVVQAMTDGLGFDDAVCRVGDFVTALSVGTGGEFGSKLRDAFSYPTIEEEMRAAISESGLRPTAPPDRSRVGALLHTFWFGDEGGDNAEAVPAFARQLENRFGQGLFELLWTRSELAATLTQVEIEARLAESR